MPSSYFSKLKTVVQDSVWKPIIGKDGGIQSSVEILVEQGKSCFGKTRLFHSVPHSPVTDLEVLLRSSSVCAARSDFQLFKQKRNLSIVGALSRMFSIPSVSGPSLQVCGYHLDRLLHDPGQATDSCKFQNIPMAACSSRAAFSDCHLDFHPRLWDGRVSKNYSVAYCGNRSIDNCRRATMSLKNREQPNKYQIYGYFIFNALKGRYNSASLLESGLRDIFGSSCRSFSAGTAPDVSFDNSARDEHISTSAVSSDERNLPSRNLKLVSGSCYLPHPEKEETGGEDAHFICTDEQAIGVADGVGGWADFGIDAGQYSRELMSNSVSAIQEEPRGSVDPFRVLEKAYSSTKAKGSSTACIIALTNEGLHAINLGDSGFMVVRDGCTVFRSPVQQHNFNLTYQLESGNSGDLPSSGQVFAIPVAPGDVVIAGTDGLFDNLYNNEITAVVVHATRAGLGPQVTAQKIAALARQRAQDKDRQTPFSTAAQDAGFRYYGGKPDDITVIVSYVSGSKDEKPSS